MAVRESDDPVIAEWVVFRNLTGAGCSDLAIALSEKIVAESSDPRRVAQALIERLVSRINMNRFDGLGPLLDEIDGLLYRAPDPRLIGEFNTMAAQVAYERGSHGTAMLRLAVAERHLRRMDELSLAATDAWHDLASAYSWLGYHEKALSAARQCQRLCARTGLAAQYGMCIQAYVGAAVHLDHVGDTLGCVRDLQNIITIGRTILEGLPAMQRVMLRYAVKRLAALESYELLEVPEDPHVDSVLHQINHLASVCEAIGKDRPREALELLDSAPVSDSFGAAEPLRLRSLALTRLGDHIGALAAERSAMRAKANEENRLRSLLINATNTRLDQERLRRMAAQYAGQAVTDPLTGLPNRRQVSAFVEAIARRSGSGMFGVLDLDGFKAVNDTHGHPSGDLVLQRVAGLFARSIRQGDLIARHGGDEFVVILPDTTLAEAERIGSRIKAAIAGEDWTSLVPGTPVTVSIGWAELDGDTGKALVAADQALYLEKRSRANA